MSRMASGPDRETASAASPTPERFREVIGHFTSGVTVITTGTGDEPLGTTASAVSSLSLEPPMLLICLKRDSATRAGIVANARFAVNILHEGQVALAVRFAGKGAGKFSGVEITDGRTGLPLITGALAHLECEVADEVVGGTHSVFLGSVLGANVADGRPLAYFRGRFGQLHEAGLEDEGRDAGSRAEVEPDAVAVRSALDAKVAIEIGAVALAGERLDVQALNRLREYNERMRERFAAGASSLAEWLEEDDRFHERLVALADNSDLVEAHRRARSYDAMVSMIRGRLAQAPADRQLVQRCCDDHEAAIEALRSGGSAALAAALRHPLHP